MSKVTAAIHPDASTLRVASAGEQTHWLEDGSKDWALFLSETRAAALHQALITRWPHLCPVVKEPAK